MQAIIQAVFARAADLVQERWVPVRDRKDQFVGEVGQCPLVTVLGEVGCRPPRVPGLESRGPYAAFQLWAQLARGYLMGDDEFRAALYRSALAYAPVAIDHAVSVGHVGAVRALRARFEALDSPFQIKQQVRAVMAFPLYCDLHVFRSPGEAAAYLRRAF